MVLHLLKLGGVLERVGAAVGSIHTFEAEIAAAVAWCPPIALDLPSLAFIASNGDVSVPLGSGMRLTTRTSIIGLSLSRRTVRKR